VPPVAVEPVPDAAAEELRAGSPNVLQPPVERAAEPASALLLRAAGAPNVVHPPRAADAPPLVLVLPSEARVQPPCRGEDAVVFPAPKPPPLRATPELELPWRSAPWMFCRCVWNGTRPTAGAARLETKFELRLSAVRACIWLLTWRSLNCRCA
jgi:hypothetical protein